LSQTYRWKLLSCGSFGNDTHILEVAYEVGSAAPAGKVSASILRIPEWEEKNGTRTYIKSLLICFSNIRGRRASPLVSSLYKISDLKRLVPQHHRVPSQASGNRRPPVERALLRRLYFLNSDHSKYVCLGFYPRRGYRAFF
jgi:hypothetical protein